MSWVFMMFMNGYMQDMDRFPTREACEDAVQIYNRAFKQSKTPALVWCTYRPQA